MNLLILSSSTGGGHDMRAFALKEWWTSKGYDAEVFHPLEETSALYRFGTKLYNFIQKRAPWCHSLYFKFLECANLHRSSRFLIGRNHFKSFIEDNKPEVLVSVHAHLNHAYLDITKQCFPESKFIIYCGEFADGKGFSRHWINPKADLFTGPFESTCETAIRKGMPPSKVQVGGLLLRQAFHTNSDKVERNSKIKLKSMGINPGENFVTLGTGANGTNNHLRICREMNKSLRNSNIKQIVALCGENRKLQKDLNSMHLGKGVKIIALLKVGAEEMVSLLSETCCLLARPGAGISAEALAMHTPIVFNICGGVMPQETNNLNYWKLHGCKTSIISKPEQFPLCLEKKFSAIGVTLPSEPGILEIIKRIGNGK